MSNARHRHNSNGAGTDSTTSTAPSRAPRDIHRGYSHGQRAGASLRLRLKSAHRACGHVQGAWWPRSTALNAELPPLFSALSRRFGDIDSVRYHRHDWSTGTPQLVEYRGRRVRTEPTESTPHVVSLTGPHIGRLALLVVPPYTDADTAYEVVTAAASAANTATPDELLGEQVRTAQASRDMHRAVQRWEYEGADYISALC